MKKTYLTRSQSKFWSAEIPVGDPFGGAAYGEFNDPTTAIIGGSALLGGLISSNGAQQAANTQASAANNATSTQLGMFNTTQKNLQPYMQSGGTALSSLLTNAQNGFTPQAYLNNADPGYQFQLQQGNQALQNSQAAQDGVLSGSALKGLINYNQGMASTGYQNAYNRWLSTNGLLNNVANLGENAAAGLGNTSANFAGSIGNSITGAGNASASGIVGSANALSNGINGAANGYLLSNMLSPGSGASIYNNSVGTSYSPMGMPNAGPQMNLS